MRNWILSPLVSAASLRRADSAPSQQLFIFTLDDTIFTVEIGQFRFNLWRHFGKSLKALDVVTGNPGTALRLRHIGLGLNESPFDLFEDRIGDPTAPPSRGQAGLLGFQVRRLASTFEAPLGRQNVGMLVRILRLQLGEFGLQLLNAGAPRGRHLSSAGNDHLAWRIGVKKLGDAGQIGRQLYPKRRQILDLRLGGDELLAR